MMKNISRTGYYRDMELFSTGKKSGRVLRRSQSVSNFCRSRENRNYNKDINNNSNNNNNNNNITIATNKTIMKMKEQKDDQYEDIRIALAGAKYCGKSALAVRYLTKRFIGEYDSHKDVTLQRSINVADKEIQLYLKDTTGTGWLNSPASLINWTSAIIVVYSITDRTSFTLARSLLELIHKIKPLNSRCTLLIGNKSDLKHLRQVEKREARRLASDYGVQFLECSASENYEDVCNSFTRLIVEAMIVQSAKKHSWDSRDAEECKQQENRIRKRSQSHSQASLMRDGNNNSSSKKDDKKELLRPVELDRIPSPTETIRETPIPQRKQSLRRKISGIGSKLVGSQNNR